jgi:hypothetical protein
MPDLGDAANAFFDAMQEVMPRLMQAATDALAKILTDHSNTAWESVTTSLQQSEFNFITRTPPSMSYNFGGVSDFYHQYDGMYYGIGTFALVLMGLASACRMFFAWGWEIPETLVRVVLGILLATSTPRIYELTINLHNRLCDAIVGAQLPHINEATVQADPLTMSIIIVVWLILGIRLLARMGYRIIYFAVLLVIGPLALAAWAIPGGDTYARMWVRCYIGLLLGQLLVAVCLRLAGGMGGMLGTSFAGLAIGIGMLLLAYDLATMFAEIRGGGLGSMAHGAIRVWRRF